MRTGGCGIYIGCSPRDSDLQGMPDTPRISFFPSAGSPLCFFISYFSILSTDNMRYLPTIEPIKCKCVDIRFGCTENTSSGIIVKCCSTS